MTLENKTLRYRRGTARRAVLVEISSTDAQLYIRKIAFEKEEIRIDRSLLRDSIAPTHGGMVG